MAGAQRFQPGQLFLHTLDDTDGKVRALTVLAEVTRDVGAKDDRPCGSHVIRTLDPAFSRSNLEAILVSDNVPHPTLILAPENSRFTFKFTLSNFNPPGRSHLPCPLCDSTPDTPSHLAKDCQSPEVCAIRSDYCEVTSEELSPILPPLDLLAEPWASAAADTQISPNTWVALSHAHARLWHARRKRYFKREAAVAAATAAAAADADAG